MRRIAAGAVAAIVVTLGTASDEACDDPAPVTPEGYQAAFRALPGNNFDGGYSLLLPDGRLVWTTGDTFLAAGGGTHNSLIVQRRGCFTQILPAVPDVAGGVFWWLGPPLLDSSRLMVLATRARQVPGGWEELGTDLAVFRLDDGLSFQGMLRTPASDAAGQAVTRYGAAAVTSGSYHYVYGVRHVWISKEIRVARVPRGKLGDWVAWRWWDGATWAADSAAAAVVGSDSLGWPASFSVHHSGSRWVAVGKDFDIVGAKVVAWTSPRLTGPWSKRDLFTPPVTGDQLSYAGLAHPWARLSSGKLLVSYAVTSPSAPFDPDRSGLRFAETDWP